MSKKYMDKINKHKAGSSEEGVKAYDVMAVYKDLVHGTGNLERRLITFNVEAMAAQKIDCFDIITKSLIDYDLVIVVVYFKVPKLIQLAMENKFAKNELSFKKIGEIQNVSYPQLYAWDFPKNSLVRAELHKIRS